MKKLIQCALALLLIGLAGAPLADDVVRLVRAVRQR